MSAYILQVKKNDIHEEVKSPSITYFTERYLSGTDNWTRVKEKTTFGDALINTLTTIMPPDDQKKILDIGCGTLWMSRLVVSRFAKVSIHGVDFAFDAILSKYPTLAIELSKVGITYEHANWMTFKASNKYDFVFDFGLFHHLIPQDWPRYVEQLNNYLMPGGHLFIRAFHLTDNNWSKSFPGGHERKGYYCYYHTLASLEVAFKSICFGGNEIDACKHSEHVEGLYHFQKKP